jgi:hypothetical protein
VGITYFVKSLENPLVRKALLLVPSLNMQQPSPDRFKPSTRLAACLWILVRCAASLVSPSANVRLEDGGWLFLVAAWIIPFVFIGRFSNRPADKSYGPVIVIVWWCVTLFCLVELGEGDMRNDIELLLVALEAILSHLNNVFELELHVKIE